MDDLEKPDNEAFSTSLAIDRTWLSHERTLMAWVRTAISMISFGFTVYKFFQFEQEGGAPHPRGWFTPRTFAIFMVSIGTIALVTAIVGHRQETRELKPQLGQRFSRAEAFALMIVAFGLMVLIATVFRN